MAVITMPNTLRCGRGCRIEQATFDVPSASDVTGSSQVRPYGVPHWTLSLVSPDTLPDLDAGIWKAMLLTLRGSVNYLHAFDPSRPQPLGSYRGAPMLASAAVYGDTLLLLDAGAGQGGGTLVPGDWLQIGTGLGTSQLILVTAPATANSAGQIAIAFEAPLRLGFAAGTAVTWSYARGHFRRGPARAGWSPSSPGMTQSLGVDLIEAW